MAKSRVTDYVLELGWDGTKVNSGIDKLEKRIIKLAKASERLTKSVATPQRQPRGPGGPRVPGGLTPDFIENKKLNMIDRANTKIRSLQATLRNFNMQAKGAKGARMVIQADINKVEQYKRTVRSMTVTTKSQLTAQRAAWTKLNHTIETSTAKLRHANKNLGFLGGVARSVGSSFKAMGLKMMAAYAIVGTVRKLHRSVVEWENLDVQMIAAFGSAAKGEEQMNFLIGTAETLGVSISSLSDGYARIGATGRMVGTSTEDIRTIFLGAAEASRAFGLSADDMQGVMRAFSQMLGKNQVMAEELKLQLGDRMPIAMGIMARAIGKTVPEMTKLMEAGKLSVAEIILFTKELSKTVRESGAYEAGINTVDAAQQRLTTSLQLSARAFGTKTYKTSIISLTNVFRNFFKDSEGTFELLGDLFGFLIHAGSFLLKLVLWPIGKTLKAIGMVWKEIKESALTKDEDVKRIGLMGRGVRFLFLLLVDVRNIISYIGNRIDRMFEREPEEVAWGTQELETLVDVWDRVNKEIAKGDVAINKWLIKNLPGIPGFIGPFAQTRLNTPASFSVDTMNVYVPEYTDPEKTRAAVANVAGEELMNEWSGNLPMVPP